MEIQRQHNRYSCLPYAFAMAMNIPAQELLSKIGHDGSKIIFPDLKYPYCCRAFNIQEIIDVVHDYGYSVTPIEFQPVSIGQGNTNSFNKIEEILRTYITNKTTLDLNQLRSLYDLIKIENKYSYVVPIKNQDRIDDYLNTNYGVLTGETLSGKVHAVAWDGKLIYDPNGSIYSKEDFIIDTFWMLKFNTI